MASVIVLVFLAVPPLAMWWMIVAQRRVRAEMRLKRAKEETPGVDAAYVDEIRHDGALTCGRPVESELPPTPDPGETGGVRALQGRR